MMSCWRRVWTIHRTDLHNQDGCLASSIFGTIDDDVGDCASLRSDDLDARGTERHPCPVDCRAVRLVGRLPGSPLSCSLSNSPRSSYKYFSYPKKVVIEVVPLPVPFPAISLCNLRNLDNIVLNQLNHIFKAESDVANISQMLSRYENGGNETTNAFIVQYLKAVAKYYPMFLSRSNDTGFYHVFRTVLTRTTLATNIDPAVLSAAGVPFKEFIVTCRLAGMSCNFSGDFAQFFDSYYYNCFHISSPVGPPRSVVRGQQSGRRTRERLVDHRLDRKFDARPERSNPSNTGYARISQSDVQ